MNALLVIACLFATPDNPPQKPLRVGISHFPPMIIIDDERISGSDFDMFEEIARGFGWQRGKDYEYKIFPTFHQLMAALEDSSVPLGLSGISVTHDRLQTMHFSQPYMDSGQRILIPPTDPQFSIIAYFGRFARIEIAVPLITLVACWVVFGILFWFFEKKLKEFVHRERDQLVPTSPVREESTEATGNIQSIGDGAEAAFDIGTTIGFGRFFPTTRFGQWGLAVACFFCNVVLIGDVVSSLTANKVEKLDNAINCPEDIKGKIVAGVKNTTSVRVAEDYSPARIIETSNFYEAVVEMRLGNAVAVIADEPVVLHYVKNNPDHAMATGVRFHPEDYGIVFALDAPDGVSRDLLKRFSLSVVKLRESGKLDFIQDHWFGE